MTMSKLQRETVLKLAENSQREMLFQQVIMGKQKISTEEKAMRAYQRYLDEVDRQAEELIRAKMREMLNTSDIYKRP